MDLSGDFRTVSGRQALAEALVRRWTTPRGGLIGDPNYGTDLTEYINDDYGPGDLAKIIARAEAEALQDERVESISSRAEISDAGVLRIEFTITEASGPFSLTVSVDNVTVDLLEVQ